MNDVVIIDNVTIPVVSGAGGPPAAWQGQHQGAAEKAFQPVIVETDP
jgi:hypothetical protein